MSIGYACLAVGVPGTAMRQCLLRDATEARLRELTAANLQALERLIDYNARSGIKLFRMSSDLIPFGSNDVNRLRWWEDFAAQLQEIGSKIKAAGMRVSMHPGQYTVLNSPDQAVVDRAVADLVYHARVLDNLQLGPEHKIILHIGGVYGDRPAAIARFAQNYKNLPESVKRRLVIENDDRSYGIDDVLSIGRQLGIPVVFDNLHHLLNPAGSNASDRELIESCRTTWRSVDGPQKIHYSQQDPLKKAGSHSASIRIGEFLQFYRELASYAELLDIMLEVKDKNLSAVKCINCTSPGKRIVALEQEWGRYKYNVLEKSPTAYQQIRQLLKDKSAYPAVEFYAILEDALNQPEDAGQVVNAAQHVWGYFKDRAAASERSRFLTLIAKYQSGESSSRAIKLHLQRMVEKYQDPYLIQSYYFVF